MFKAYEKRINKAYEAYTSEIERIAEEARQNILIPYLDRMGYTFLTGNGTYTIFNPKDRSNVFNDVDLDKLPKRIKNILQLEVNHWGMSELALWMRDYHGQTKGS